MAANNTTPMSYSTAAQHSGSLDHSVRQTAAPAAPPPRQTGPSKESNQRRSPSPSHVPKTSSPEDSVYVLTLLTDKAHHARMTDLRNRYFPKKLNKLAAHLTLFHALPGSVLESKILPLVEEVAAETSPFKVHAAKTFRLKKGIAVSISAHEGGDAGKQIHEKLRSQWAKDGFLSDQDSGGCRLHYTLMNKVDDEATIDQAYNEINRSWKGDSGTVEGLAIYQYERGFWKWQRNFPFKAQENST